MKHFILSFSLVAIVCAQESFLPRERTPDNPAYANYIAKGSNQAAFVTAFWLACDLLDESGYTAAHPLPSYDWPTLKRRLLPIMYWCDAHAKATEKANLTAAIFAVKVFADEPGVDTSRIR